MATLIGQDQIIKASLMRKFLGNLYFDVFIWTFNNDGTGVIDVPAFGMHPANQFNFTFYVIESHIGIDASISIDFPSGEFDGTGGGGGTTVYHASFGSGG